jgi:hypothetical protein
MLPLFKYGVRQKTTMGVDPKNIGASYFWQLKQETASLISTWLYPEDTAA